MLAVGSYEQWAAVQQPGIVPLTMAPAVTVPDTDTEEGLLALIEAAERRVAAVGGPQVSQPSPVWGR